VKARWNFFKPLSFTVPSLGKIWSAIMKIIQFTALACFMGCISAGSALADDCSGRDHTTGTVLGAAGGAAIGGVASHDAGGAIAGALLGGLAGNAIARSEDCNRQQGYDQRDQGYEQRGNVQQEYYLPPHAAPDENDYWGVESYDDFNNDYRHIWSEIQTGREDGSLTRYDARRYADQLQQIRRRADSLERSGRFDPEDIESRLVNLRQTIHFARREGAEDRYTR
jgi:uncharacterized protein YcfJ